MTDTLDPPIPLVQRVDYLKEICREKTVLHLGCTDWPYTKAHIETGTHLHLQLLGIASELWGLDADQAGIDELADHGVTRLLQADLERLDELDLSRKFDVIVAGEMIEHLSNPGLFLRGIRRFMRPDGVLVITTTNAYCGFRALRYVLRGRGGRLEPVHPDHVAYYSYSTLSRLLARERLAVKQFMFYDMGREHRPFSPFYINWMNDVCVRIARQLADGVIAECTLAEEA